MTQYSRDIDYLIAAIVYLGSQGFFWARTPKHMASELSLQEERLEKIFDRYPGIFRKSAKPSKNGQHFYSLQARYAQREGGDTSEPEQISYIAPLGDERIKLLVDFVRTLASEEVESRRRLWGIWVSTGAAVVSAVTAILVALMKA